MPKSNEVGEWVYKAEEDFEVARILVHRKGHGAPDNVCFCAQQGAEKYLKAYLTRLRIPFPKTHDLMYLLNLLVAKDPFLEALRPILEELKPYAIDIRYPGDRASSEEAREAFKKLKQVRAVLRKRLHLK